jgi:hypothetical protein
MSKLSRRSLVSSAATLPALAVPAVASALPAEGDLELKQLGVRLLKENRNFDTLCADPNPDDNAVNEASGRIAALMPPIFSRTATTRDGLAVQAAAAAIACRELWDGIGDWSSAEDPSWQVERPFIEAVCRHTGVAHPVVTSEPADAPIAAEPNATKLDPILAAIAAHKKAWDDLDHAIARQGEYEEAQWAAGRSDDDDLPEVDTAHEAVNDAVDALGETVPTTLAGAKALLDYIADAAPAAFGGDLWRARVSENVAEAIGSVL